MIIHKMYIFEQTLETVVATEGGTFWFGFFKNYLENVFLFQENKFSIY